MFNWKLFDECKPKRSGLYFVKVVNQIEIAYFDSRIGQFVFFDSEDYQILELCGHIHLLYWSNMPRFSCSKLLNRGFVIIKEG